MVDFNAISHFKGSNDKVRKRYTLCNMTSVRRNTELTRPLKPQSYLLLPYPSAISRRHTPNTSPLIYHPYSISPSSSNPPSSSSSSHSTSAAAASAFLWTSANPLISSTHPFSFSALCTKSHGLASYAATTLSLHAEQQSYGVPSTCKLLKVER